MSVLDPISSLPIGPEVPAHAAPRPEHRVLTGRLIRLEPLDPDRHGASLWRETHGVGAAERWQYLFDAPFAEEKPFRDFLARKAASTDPLFYAIVDQSSGFAVGFEALMRIDTAHRCIEVGNILYGKSLRRRPASQPRRRARPAGRMSHHPPSQSGPARPSHESVSLWLRRPAQRIVATSM